MASVKIDIVGMDELDLIVTLYGQIFQPPQDHAYFRRRLEAHRVSLMMVAELERRPTGFLVGYELRYTTYYAWLIGVLPEARRMGVASQLLEAQEAWCRENDYEMVRFECYNHHRPVLHVALSHGFSIVGIRYDSRTLGNLVIFEKQLGEETA
ncbi:MAG: hypothetical protein FLDDKLPJ_03077 [Phycisphaerae bacterium]|nr:hypothetical protein [Phycisphaerae bacterium]